MSSRKSIRQALKKRVYISKPKLKISRKSIRRSPKKKANPKISRKSIRLSPKKRANPKTARKSIRRSPKKRANPKTARKSIRRSPKKRANPKTARKSIRRSGKFNRLYKLRMKSEEKYLTPFSIILGENKYPITYTIEEIVKKRISDEGEEEDIDIRHVIIRANLPEEYPDTEWMRTFREKNKKLWLKFIPGDRTEIAYVEFEIDSEKFYLSQLFVYPALIPSSSLEEEKKGLKGIGKYLLCQSLKYMIEKYGMRPFVTAWSGGGDYRNRLGQEKMSISKAKQWFSEHPVYYDDFIQDYRKSQEQFIREGIDRSKWTFEDELVGQAMFYKGVIDLYTYYHSSFGFEAVDPHIFDHFDWKWAGGIEMVVPTSVILSKCSK